MTVIAAAPQPANRRVRVWFGEHVIADYTAEPVDAIRYQEGMTRRFASLRIIIEPVTAAVGTNAADS